MTKVLQNIRHRSITLKLLLLLSVLFVGVGEAWGNTWTGYVGVGLGVGKAKVEVVSDAIVGGGTQRTSDWATDTSKKSASWSSKLGTTKGHVKFTAEAGDGYSFEAWYENSGCTSGRQTGNSYSTSSNKGGTYTYYAKFMANTYTVKFNLNYNGAPNPSSKTVTFDAVYGDLPTPTRNGYTFVGWYTTASGGTQVTSSTPVKTADNHSIYARWAPITYSVAFNGNGSTVVSMSNVSFTYDTPKALTENAYTKTDAVTFNTNGGTLAPNVDNPTHVSATFDGWEDRNPIIYNNTTYNYTTFDAPYYANTYGDLLTAFGYNKYSLIDHYVRYGQSEGRSCKGATLGLYPDKATVNNLTTTADATVTLYAHWSQNDSITLPDATMEDHVLLGWSTDGTQGNIVGEAGDSYAVPLNGKTLTAVWKVQYTPTMNGSNSSMKVGEEQANAFILEHVFNPQAHITIISIDSINNGDDKVIEYDAVNNKIIAHNAGTATIYLTQAETSTIEAGTSTTYTYTVTKRNNTLDPTISAISLLVEGTANITMGGKIDDVSKPINVAISNQSTPTHPNPSDGTNIITHANNVVTAMNAGTARITVSQAEDYKYKAAKDKVFNITVEKHDPTLSWNNNGPFYFNSTIGNITTLTAGDAELLSYSSSVTNVATFDTNTVTIYNVPGNTELRVTSAENYKWNPKEFTKQITPQKLDNHVPFTLNSSNYGSVFHSDMAGTGDDWSSNGLKLGNANDGAGFSWNEYYSIIYFTGIPDKLTFEYRTYRYSIWPYFHATKDDLNPPLWTILESPDNNNWTQVWSVETDNDAWMDGGQVQLSPTTQYLKFIYHGNYAGWFRNVHVSELQRFKANPREIDFGKVEVGEFEARLFGFEHANAGYAVTTESSLPAVFTVEPEILSNTGGDRLGVENCQVTFRPTTAGDYNETITFRDQLNHLETVTVKGEATNLHVPKFTWNPQNRPYYCTSSQAGAQTYCIPNICTSSNNGEGAPQLSYSSDKPTKAVVIKDTLYIYVRDDETPYPTITITVSQDAVPGEWEAMTKQYTFTPRKKIDLAVPFTVTKTIFDNAYDIQSPQFSRTRIEWFHTVTDVDPGYEWDAGSERMRIGGIWTDFLIGYPCYDWSEKAIVFNFEGMPDSLTFSYKTNWGTATYLASGLLAQFRVYESSDGVNWTMIWSNGRSNSQTYDTQTLPLSHTSSFVKLAYQGNFAAFFKDVSITAFDGNFFVRPEGENKYWSRGGASRSEAVLDDYGIAVKKTRSSNRDNSKKYTYFQHVDNRKFLCESGGSFVTNSTSKRTYSETKNDDGTYIFKSENDTKRYLQRSGSSLALVSNISDATHWVLETAEQHNEAMSALRNAQVITATTEFGEPVETLAKLRERLFNEDYDRDTVFKYNPVTPQQQVQNSPEGSIVYSSPADPVLTSLTPGLYCLNVKAFYRIGQNDVAYQVYEDGYDCPVAYVSFKDETTSKIATSRLASVFDEVDIKDNSGNSSDFHVVKEGESYYYYPNNLTSANVFLQRDRTYDNDVYLFVEGNTASFSIVAPSNANSSNWLCYKDITLTRLYRKEFTFDGKVDSVWNNGANWEYEGGRGVVPEKMHKVVIAAPAVVGNGANAGAYKITFDSQVQNSSVTVKAGGSLSVREGGFVGATHSNLVLEADGNGQTGALLLHPEMEDMPNATVQFYSTIANKKTDKEWQWQYIGTPIKNPDTNEHILYQCWLYQYSTLEDEWSNAGNWGHMEPFRGYAFTRDNYRSSGPRFGFCGQLNKAETKKLPLQYKKEGEKEFAENQIANSWTAPIRISNLEKEDFNGVGQTIYYYPRDGKGSVTSIAPFTAEYTGSEIIPAMQGFFVRTKEWTEHKLKLDYKRLVWEFEKEGAFKNEPLKAPSREKDTNDELLSRVCINLMSADSIPDHLYLIEKEGEGFSREFTEGYDAPKYFVDGLPCIYTYETSGTHLAVSATDDVVGTYLAINTNASQNYTLTFSKVIGEGLGLRDLVTNTIVPITEGVQYAFTAPANSSPMLRFVVVEHEETPQWNNNNGTSLEDVGGEFKIWQSGEILSVIGAGSHASLRLYDAAGKLILSEFFNEATAINLNALPTGVYMVQVNDKTEKVLH
ncbi:MAG: InlB B-repeat-containing protein [Paludibacteraceae bacterium]|nr:InlB B-repeat-containing protein [Paludibacteraceae bacterium]